MRLLFQSIIGLKIRSGFVPILLSEQHLQPPLLVKECHQLCLDEIFATSTSVTN